jgi:UDP-N-acetylmuramoyl-L-alanyl-D-glutamate--2,6-diaminopimelate ligase
VAACDFDVVAFTNVGHDHLDFHPTWEDYLAAKAQLIDLCANSASKALEKTAILNRDDRSFDHLARKSIPRRWSYGMDVGADLWAGDIRSDLAGSDFRIGGRWGEARTRLPMPGRFNVYNALCAATIALAFEVTLTEVAECLTAFPGVRGRLESIALGQPFGVYVDFAHSAGSLAATLGALRPLTEGRLMVVFGSTARADHDRPGMGIAAAAGSDYFVISTDDPLTEDPAAIAQEVASGVPPGSRYEIILDRREAIRHIIAMARPGDLVLLAGKGHEQTMRIGDRSMPWNDRTEAEAAIRNL